MYWLWVFGAFLGVFVIPSPLILPSRLASTLQFIRDTEDIWNSLQAIVTTLAIIAAGLWFLARRQRHPRLDITHSVTHDELQPGTIWVRVEVRATNRGDVKVSISKGLTAIQQVKPLPEEVREKLATPETSVTEGETEVQWPVIRLCEESLGEFEVEPGETDSVSYDFFLPTEIEVVLIYTYLSNESKRTSGHGWPVSTVYSMRDGVILSGSSDHGEQEGKTMAEKENSERKSQSPKRLVTEQRQNVIKPAIDKFKKVNEPKPAKDSGTTKNTKRGQND